VHDIALAQHNKLVVLVTMLHILEDCINIDDCALSVHFMDTIKIT
jgi:hypothetical protein